MLNNEFVRDSVDTIFLFKKYKNLLIIQIYVDDIIFGATNNSLYEDFAKLMQEEFEMSMMGEPTFFLGLQIKQSKEGIFINQTKYIKEMLKKFGIKNAKEIGIPISPTCKLDKDENDKNINEKLYEGTIGSLLYLTASRPNIHFSVCICTRLQSNPKELHMLAIKKKFRYLVNTSNLRL